MTVRQNAFAMSCYYDNGLVTSFRRILSFLAIGLACCSALLAQAGAAKAARDEREQPEVRFISFVLDDVQKNWDKMLPAQAATPYHHAKLVLYRDSFPSACGKAQAATGPFYCPGDEKVYLDLEFFSELKRRFGAPGEFAQAYVIAHEIGHHVQKLLGIEPRIRKLQEQNPAEAKPLSVRLELQADCYAGIWANSTEQRNLVNGNDIVSALRAAAAVGDDRLQRAAGRWVNPESFTHGSSEERVQWFRRGLAMGKISACNTFPKS
jgi:predicted metalloprotease